jgi:hypothetical protein
MPRGLAFFPTLLSLTTSASSETSPGPMAAVHATLLTPARTDNRLFRSLTGAGAVHSTAVACCKVCSVGKPAGIPKCTRVDPAQSDRLNAGEESEQSSAPFARYPNPARAAPSADRILRSTPKASTSDASRYTLACATSPSSPLQRPHS